MPDELAVAHEGRLAVLNDCTDVAALYALVEAHLRESSVDPSGFPKLHQLALVSGLVPQAYAKLHTLLPAIRVVCREGDDAPHGTETSRQSRARIRRSTQTTQAQCCTSCIEEDLRGERGFSWFRRFHHVRGFDWCPVHKCRLRVVESTNPFRKLPHQWLEEGKTAPINTAEEELTPGSVLDRYVAIYMALLERERPTRISSIRRKLMEAARDRGLATSEKPNLLRLSDFVAELIPATWLARHIDAWPEKVPRKYFRHIDAAVRGGSQVAAGDAYVLAAAVLFSSTPEAIALLTGMAQGASDDTLTQRVPAGVVGDIAIAA